jgi:serine/threonine-protein kinase
MGYGTDLPDLDGYKAIRILGQGGMGTIYLAEAIDRPDEVVVKVLAAELAESEADHFLHATQALSEVSHPNVVSVLDFGRLADGRVFLVMDRLRGRDLADVLAESPMLPVHRAVSIARQVAAALDAVHAKDIVHLDVKPSNIFVTPLAEDAETISLLDFGIMRRVSDTNRGSSRGLGAPEYWSPEQAVGRNLDGRSDLYSLGVVLYETLTGRLPFMSHTYSDIVEKHLHEEPPEPSRDDKKPIPESLRRIVGRCLAKTPEERFENAGALGEALADVHKSSDSDLGRAKTVARRTGTDSEDESAASGSRASEQGTVVGSYRLLEILGVGGMGRVYLAEHMRLGRKVALKMLRSQYVQNPRAVQRFFAEARAVNKIGHENIVEITDFFENDNGACYYIMELLAGVNLKELQEREGILALTRSLGMAVQVCSALSAVHEAGIVHRDLKPENIILTERGGQTDFVKLLDFGVAKLMDPDGDGVSMERTAAGAILGTPEYMSPEQASGGKSVDYRSDIYSLGVILYELITGQRPFEAKSFGEMVVQHLTVTPPKPSKVKNLPHLIPNELEALIVECLEKEPVKRVQSVKDIENRLRRLAEKHDFELESFRKAPSRARHRRRWLIAAAAALVHGVGVLGAYAVVGGGDEQTEARRAAAASKAQVDVTFVSAPEGAAVFREGDSRPLGLTPFSTTLARSSDPAIFEFRMPGYKITNQVVTLDRDTKLEATLAVTIPRATDTETKETAKGRATTLAKDKKPSRAPASNKAKAKPTREKPAKPDRRAVIDPFATD